jgi:hypothetical protein
MTVRTGWAAWQLCHPKHAASLVFAYRLGAAAQSPRWLLRDLNPTARYTVQRGIGGDRSVITASGEQLMRDGLAGDIPRAGGRHSSAAAVYVIAPQA